TGDHDVGITVEDRLVAERHRTQTRAAQLVNSPGRTFNRDAGRDRGLASRVLPFAGGEDLAPDYLRHSRRLDTSALQDRLNGDLAEFVSRKACECAIK